MSRLAAMQQMELFGQRWQDGLRRLFPASNSEPQPYDRGLLVLILTLMTLGLLMVASASMPEATRLTGDPYYFIKRQMIFLAGALVIAAVVLRVPVHYWERYSWLLMLVGLLSLIAVLFIGRTVNGATRWIPLGPFNFQVAELAKLALFVFLAGYLVRRHQEVRENFKGFVKALAVFGVYATLLIQQPDFGTVVVMFVTTTGMLFLGGARLGQFVALILVGLGGFIGLVATSGYRMARIQSFMDPWADPFGTGYQLTQSLMAYGRGDWFGEGLGNSIQKLEYLPEAHTDFIFAVLGEELGFVGVIGVLSLLLLLAMRALWIGHLALKQEQAFSGYLAYGIGIWFSFQTAVNVGASVGVLPTKGLTLPLVSYGGSSLWIMTAAVALLLRIDHERRIGVVPVTPAPEADSPAEPPIKPKRRKKRRAGNE
ncbi:cell division protein FtsW [Ferrimonas marina]|uniref:Probable peptidoglycan glycosyltransferase FtsW n=1 Tax=Ferrimonas marina TaxID=299255 RepID=A0A1M5XFM8_9GAMM|nr:cell division protein FtsW [Ferrimonas marina]SHH98647.1 cell division-specific peptidoglycan biosynthesis regulator FtsW [Ferrimonas marina]